MNERGGRWIECNWANDDRGEKSDRNVSGWEVKFTGMRDWKSP